MIGGQTYTLSYDAENRLVELQEGGATIAQFTYDGDGNRVQSTIGSTTTTFVGTYYEKVTGGAETKYYYAGASRVATLAPGASARVSVGSAVSYLLTDQLGSTNIAMDSSGATVSELQYDAWGSVRYSSGETATKYTYTAQYSDSYRMPPRF